VNAAEQSSLRAAVASTSIDTGSAWAVGVSGGADSVALLRLLVSERSDLRLIVAHLNHQARGRDSDNDAEFVRALSDQLGVQLVVARRDEIESPASAGQLPQNLSARYRKLRHLFFAQVVATRGLQGVLLAHHADDQAETVLHRLLRGSAAIGLSGMSDNTTIGDLRIVRPLLDVRRDTLRAYLRDIHQGWREDASNESDHSERNRLRRILTAHGELFEPLIELGKACAQLRQWVRSTAPTLAEEFRVREIQELPRILARESAQRWLLDRGVAPDELTPDVVERLIHLCDDAASAAHVQFPGAVGVSRRSGMVVADRSS
jgi:tRNA(Ile)-lysidine synthase